LHALGDMLLTIGVCIAGIIIYINPDWWIADPICTYIFSIIVFFTVKPITWRCVSILMESSPTEIDSAKMIQDIKNATGSNNVHDFHLWYLSVGRLSLSCHVDCPQPMENLKKVTKMLNKKWGIDHLTIQMEDSSSENKHFFACEQHTHHKIE